MIATHSSALCCLCLCVLFHLTFPSFQAVRTCVCVRVQAVCIVKAIVHMNKATREREKKLPLDGAIGLHFHYRLL